MRTKRIFLLPSPLRDVTTATRVSRSFMAHLDAGSAEKPPAPSEMFARLGVLLLVALCFGLAAQLLVGGPN